MKYLIAGLLQGLFWWLVLGLALWLTRRYFPRAEAWLFAPVTQAIGRCWRALRAALSR